MSNVQASEVSMSVRSDFNFTVEKFPLFGPDRMPTDQYGLFRSDTGFIEGVKSVSSRYVPHNTDDVCALVEAASELFDGEVECKAHWNQGHYVTIAPTRDERRAIFGTSDNIFPRVIIRAGYDGQAFTGTIGYYRDACKNLGVIRDVSKTSVSIRHSSGLRPSIDNLIATFDKLSSGWGNLVEVAAQLESREVRMKEFLDEIFGQPEKETGRGATIHANRNQAIWNRIHAERHSTGRPTMVEDRVSAWEAYNSIQGYVQHDAQAKQGFKDEFSRILRAANDASVRKAESIVMRLLNT